VHGRGLCYVIRAKLLTCVCVGSLHVLRSSGWGKELCAFCTIEGGNASTSRWCVLAMRSPVFDKYCEVHGRKCRAHMVLRPIKDKWTAIENTLCVRILPQNGTVECWHQNLIRLLLKSKFDKFLRGFGQAKKSINHWKFIQKRPS